MARAATGWVAFIVDEGTLLVWNGSAWGDFFSTVTSIQNLALLGVGTTADATNPLSAKLNNVLWVAKTVAEGGDGHLRYKLSKESAAKTLSFLFQNNFSGRAEVGLTGDDDFHLKVSPDGSAWVEALKIDKTTGLLTLLGFTDPVATRALTYAAPFDALAFNGMQVNGGMEVSQEHGTAAVTLVTGTESYVVDGWTAKFVSAATLACSAQRVSSPTPPAGLQCGLQLKATTGLTTLATGDYAYLSTPIEGYRVSRLDLGKSTAQYVSLGFWVYATIAGTATLTLQNSAGNLSYPANFTINSPATWEYKTVTVEGIQSGTWLYTTGIGLRAIFCFGSGATNQGTASTWNADGKFATSSTTNFMASTNNVCVITSVVVLPGTEVPLAARSQNIMRPFSDELATCRRYFWLRNFGTNQYICNLQAVSATQAVGPVLNFAEMRSIPAIAVLAVGNFSAQPAIGGNLAASALALGSTVDAIFLSSSTFATGLVAGDAVNFFSNVPTWMSANARL